MAFKSRSTPKTPPPDLRGQQGLRDLPAARDLPERLEVPAPPAHRARLGPQAAVLDLPEIRGIKAIPVTPVSLDL
jgi:hypothetical protein